MPGWRSFPPWSWGLPAFILTYSLNAVCGSELALHWFSVDQLSVLSFVSELV